MLWRLRALVSLHWRFWDHRWVVFDVGSGQTHLLDEITAAVLASLENAPCDTETLLALAVQESAVSDHVFWSEALTTVLERLVAAELIELAEL
jgi:PqqD family protein of HPr-rel-A system